MIEQTTITSLLNSYPNLALRFKNAFPKIDFHIVTTQLQWSVNETELKRGLHRLHCLLQLIEKQNTFPELAPLANDLEKHHHIREALLALLLIDSCKGSTPAADALKTMKYDNPPKDSVVFFFDSLQKHPDIYPIFGVIGLAAQQYLKDHLFYCHMRHLQLGEVPPESLSDFNKLFGTESPHITKERLNLLYHFWTINWLGFDLPKCGDNQISENIGPTVSQTRLQQLQRIHQCLVVCTDQKSLQPLADYYIQQLSPEIQSKTFSSDPSTNTSVKIALGRLMMLLRDKNDNETCIRILKALADNHLSALTSMLQAEKNAFSKHHFLAVTFLPAVFWKLCNLRNKDTLLEQTLIYINLQKAIYTALYNLENNTYAGNRSIPMFALIQDMSNEFLNNFSQHQNYQVQLDIAVGKFITITPKLKAPVASDTPVTTVLSSAPSDQRETLSSTTNSPAPTSTRPQGSGL